MSEHMPVYAGCYTTLQNSFIHYAGLNSTRGELTTTSLYQDHSAVNHSKTCYADR